MRWQVRGYQSSNQPQPDFIQDYDGGTKPPHAAEAHMYALLDKNKANCVFCEIVDVDTTLNIQGIDGNEQKFKTVRCVER